MHYKTSFVFAEYVHQYVKTQATIRLVTANRETEPQRVCRVCASLCQNTTHHLRSDKPAGQNQREARVLLKLKEMHLSPPSTPVERSH